MKGENDGQEERSTGIRILGSPIHEVWKPVTRQREADRPAHSRAGILAPPPARGAGEGEGVMEEPRCAACEETYQTLVRLLWRLQGHSCFSLLDAIVAAVPQPEATTTPEDTLREAGISSKR